MINFVKGENVLIHCKTEISLSSIVVIAYIVSPKALVLYIHYSIIKTVLNKFKFISQRQTLKKIQ